MLELEELVNRITPESLEILPKKLVKGTGDRGIYFLYDGDELIYIGKSLAGIEGRISAHHVEHTNYSKLLLLDKTDEEIGTIEIALIQKYQPKENKQLYLSRALFDKTPKKRKSKKEVKSFEDGYNAALFDLLNAHKRMDLSITIMHCTDDIYESGCRGLHKREEYDCINETIRKNTINAYKHNKIVSYDRCEGDDTWEIKNKNISNYLENERLKRNNQ